MEKKLLHSDEEYFDLCESEAIGYIQRQYGSQSCDIENGIDWSKFVQYAGEWIHIEKKPSHYPCIFIYTETYEDCYKGQFIYLEDFNNSIKEE